MAIQHICDRCKNLVESGHYSSVGTYDFCEKCYREFALWLDLKPSVISETPPIPTITV